MATTRDSGQQQRKGGVGREVAGGDHPGFRLGLPAWAFPGWRGRYFLDRPSTLASYATVFNTVEGNTTFYRTPDPGTVERWRAAVAGSDFRFCFKLPREVTHERWPHGRVLDGFLDAIRPLAPNLGPMLVQFPATIGPDEIGRFETVFAAVRSLGRFAIEVRHPAYFDQPERLEPVLERFDAGRIIMDARPIHDGDPDHPEVLSARHEKPDVPVLTTVYNDLAFVRLVMHPDLVSNPPYLDRWARRVAGWLGTGADVTMMIHCPNNLHCPPLARDFQERLLKHGSAGCLPRLPAWPVPQQATLL